MLKKHNIDVSTQLEVEDGASQDAENSDGTKAVTKMLVAKSEPNSTDATDMNGKVKCLFCFGVFKPTITKYVYLLASAIHISLYGKYYCIT